MSNAIITKLPDMAKSFQIMRIIDELPTATNHHSLLGGSIIHACLTKQPANEIIKMIKEAAADNYDMMCDTVGERLCNEIINL